MAVGEEVEPLQTQGMGELAEVVVVVEEVLTMPDHFLLVYSAVEGVQVPCSC